MKGCLALFKKLFGTSKATLNITLKLPQIKQEKLLLTFQRTRLGSARNRRVSIPRLFVPSPFPEFAAYGTREIGIV